MLAFANGGAKKKTRSKKVKMGRVTKPVDVRAKSDVDAFEKVLEKGPLTLVLVYADWCGACHRFKENKWNHVMNMPNRTMNISSVRDDMISETSLANAKVPHYPTLLLVGKDKKPAEFTMPNGEVTNALPPQAKENVTQIVKTPVPELPEPEAVNAVVNSVVSEPVEMTARENANATVDGMAMPPSMKMDLQQSIQNATAVANKPSKNIVGGGLYGALTDYVTKAAPAALLYASASTFGMRKMTKKRGPTKRRRMTMRKRNKFGRFSRRR